jgi:PAS domain S-box-containing protein
MSETVRVNAVKQFENYDLQLDTELQELISMASEICDTPIALITLLDEKTQWIKVRKGVDVESTPRSISFCTHTIASDDLMMVHDAQLDERFVNNPLVTGEHNLRFYAGAPLTTHDGQRLGTLCVFDRVPRKLNKHQQIMLKMLSKQAINVMELKLSYAELEDKKRETEDQKQTIRDAEIRLRSFFESSVNFHVLLGKNGEVLDYNKTAYNFIKRVHQAKLTRGDLFVTYVEPSFVSTFLSKYKLSLTGVKSYEEGFTDYAEHGIIWWEAAFEPAYDNDNNVIGLSYSIRNVTERKKFEQRIISQNQSLVNIAYIQSHEYRGPLTSIMGLMNLIKEEDYQPPVEYLQLLETAINKLDDKITEIVTQVNNTNLENVTTLPN